jgi:cytochrome o ubiquinol oxidase subunit 1
MYRGRLRFTSPMMWSIGFLVTFTIGGMSGVMLAIPPADYLMHNSTFLVAHFHNMIIPGVLFGFLAGYMFWFPKAIGFKLDERLGKWSFWCWTIGFYLAFMPLYILGFMGMPRRMQHYDIPEWQPHLIIAAFGAFVILVGIILMVVQLVVSARDWRNRRDLTGDPWDGYTLEWLTSSPPAPYNFAVLPEIHDREAFLDMKQRGVAYKRPAKYHDILLPKNSSIGLFIGGLAFVLGFAMVWHIFWLAGLCAAAIFAAIVMRTYDDDTEYRIPAKEVEKIENERFKLLERGLKAQATESLGGAMGSLQESPT